MKKHQVNATHFLLFATTLILTACVAPAPVTQTAQPAFTTTTNTPIAAKAIPTTSVSATETDQPAPTDTLTAAPTNTPTPASTATITKVPTQAETIGEQLKSHIVFYLIIPEKNRRDACGNIQVEPIISKRIRTGDKLNDVQIALNMLFGIGSKYYGAYYNALWDTSFTIDNYEYDAKKDYMTLQFGGYFPYSRLSSCDKHGIREQVWATFFHYKFKEKTFKVADGFLIDRLGGD